MYLSYFYPGIDYIRLYISLKVTRNKITLKKGKPIGLLWVKIFHDEKKISSFHTQVRINNYNELMQKLTNTETGIKQGSKEGS